MAIANGELSIESRRQGLASDHEFEPYSAFVRMDRNQDGLLDAGDI